MGLEKSIITAHSLPSRTTPQYSCTKLTKQAWFFDQNIPSVKHSYLRQGRHKRPQGMYFQFMLHHLEDGANRRKTQKSVTCHRATSFTCDVKFMPFAGDLNWKISKKNQLIYTLTRAPCSYPPTLNQTSMYTFSTNVTLLPHITREYMHS